MVGFSLLARGAAVVTPCWAFTHAELTTMTASRSIHCPLIDHPATLTVERLPVTLSGIGDSGTWSQFDVDCSEAQHCSRAAEDGCPRRRADRRLNGA